MPKRSRTPGKRHSSDPILIAAHIFEQITGEPIKPAKDQPPAREKNPHAVALGKLGGPKGGKARAEKLSARKRKQIAKRAAAVRWKPKNR